MRGFVCGSKPAGSRGGIAVARRVAAELDPAVGRDHEPAVAGAFEAHAERQRDGRGAVVARELREAADVVRALLDRRGEGRESRAADVDRPALVRAVVVEDARVGGDGLRAGTGAAGALPADRRSDSARQVAAGVVVADIDQVRALVDLDLEVPVVGAPLLGRGIDVIAVVVDDEDPVRRRTDGAVADGVAEGLEVVPERGQEGIRVLRRRERRVHRIAVRRAAAGHARVAAELEPAVGRDRDRRVARAVDRQRERHRRGREGVVAAEGREAREVVRARQHPRADRHRGRCRPRQRDAESQEERRRRAERAEQLRIPP